ncbi:MAG TPA: GNAT family protein [Gammaproteobacteria bacterium]|jgi:RimJ/RimL family protein N-acetyltransferase|nr:GNAT family protein [Gammaproteobacteria bacterium]
MEIESQVLSGSHVRLEPLERHHVDALMDVTAGDASLYQWTIVPRGRAETERYVDAALAMRDAGTAVPYATVRQSDGAVIGCTRFFDLLRWDWPSGHERHGRPAPDVGEIGYTWLKADAIRTAANTEAKFLMLAQAFERWKMLRICLMTHAGNKRSQAAIERIGGKFEGVIRANKLAPDNTPRDSARYSIVAPEWPEVKQRLQGFLNRDRSA